MKKKAHSILTALFLVLASLALSHCSSTGKTQEDPEALYQEAEEEFKDERYLMAIEKFRDIKNRFPYSQRAADAELRIADAYFEQENFLEAESAYEIFRELHPTHPKSDYVQYRIGLSYFQLIPENSARDLSAAHRAIEAFQRLEARFPNSEFTAKGKEHIVEARKRLAEHESNVANFYFQRKHYLSAQSRYSALLQDYGRLGYDELALFRLGECYLETRMAESAKNAFQRLVKEYPQSEYVSQAQAHLEDLTKKN